MTAQFEDRLLTALLDEYGTLTVPDSEPDVAPRARRLPSLSILFAGLVTAGVTAAVVVAALWGGVTPASIPAGHDARARSAPSTATVAPAGAHRLDVGYVVHGMDAALSANTDVLHELVHAPDSQTGAPTIEETWTRGGTDSSHTIMLNAQGQPVSGVLMSVTSTQTTTTTIDYASQTYTQHTYPSVRQHTGPAPAPATPVGEAATLRDAVRAGHVTLVGPARIDGQQTIALRETRSPYGTIELWVDPSNYLPVQEIDTPTGQTPDSVQSIRTQFQWLPPTKANLAELTPAGAIPPGFLPRTGD